MARSWLDIDPSSDFSLANIPFGIISTPDDPSPHVGIAIGTYVLDLKVLADGIGGWNLLPYGGHESNPKVFAQPTLNAFAQLGRAVHRHVRERIQDLLSENTTHPDLLKNNAELREKALVPQQRVQMHLPMAIGDYTDFYAGYHHAYAVGVMFRGPQNALQPNYTHLPVGYHGRASSIVVSGTPVRRPVGQILLDPKADPKQPTVAPSRRLDIELELGCFITKSNPLSQPVGIDEAEEHVFGYVLLNDWSARDIQTWEYVPLGPFNGKNFATTISPWVVLADALEPFRAKGIENPTPVQGYLKEKRGETVYDIQLEVDLTTPEGNTTTVTKTSGKNLMWSFPQMIAHHTLGGCPLRPGDLLGSGTISGPVPEQSGSLLELSEGGKREIQLNGGNETRTFLKDGDTVTLRGFCVGKEGERVGFGECTGRVQG
ncbi:fumarylacetoacetase [Neurospora tetraspora]|uniref:Fumarylacetoacetase n=1 Tax=Neurospora tetraspora TaxID=94610 RepID=A0AAE0MQS9_9PEZI|nr:fumarylacetoacetase [Neurospora tetraspora]